MILTKSQQLVKTPYSRHYLTMKEYLTDAIVLDTEDADLDRIFFLYTSGLGKIRAKAKSARKITSKLAGHLEPLSMTKVRLIEKNGFQIVDAILIRRFDASPQAIELLQFIKEMTFETLQDKKIWLTLKKSFEEIKEDRFSLKPLLGMLGFAPDFAACAVCKNKAIKYFSPKEQVFFCSACARKIGKNEVVSIE